MGLLSPTARPPLRFVEPAALGLGPVRTLDLAGGARRHGARSEPSPGPYPEVSALDQPKIRRPAFRWSGSNSPHFFVVDPFLCGNRVKKFLQTGIRGQVRTPFGMTVELRVHFRTRRGSVSRCQQVLSFLATLFTQAPAYRVPSIRFQLAALGRLASLGEPASGLFVAIAQVLLPVNVFFPEKGG